MPERVRYLRVSLLRACNFNCFYCSPPAAGPRGRRNFTSPEKFKAAIELMIPLGIRKVRFTGGEPTLYKWLPELIAYTKNLDGSIHTAITTNGCSLESIAPRLEQAGLDSVNVSLDTLNRKKFKAITTVDCFESVVTGIRAVSLSFPAVKLNCVMIRGVNSDEARAMVEFANELGIDIRFIEYMPTRYGLPHDRWYISGDTIREGLPYTFYPIESDSPSAARYYKSGDLDIRVGFISPVTHPFCANCDRVRLTANGNLYGCLFSEKAINLFDLLNAGYEAASEGTHKLMVCKTQDDCPGLFPRKSYLPSFLDTGG